jgi:hypothetical protein
MEPVLLGPRAVGSSETEVFAQRYMTTTVCEVDKECRIRHVSCVWTNLARPEYGEEKKTKQGEGLAALLR